MNGFLVLLCHSMDDLPIAFCATRDEAMRLVEVTEPMPRLWVRKVFNTDCSTPVCIRLVEFKAGMPISCNVVRDFDD